jgi:hypothetical protein
MRTTPALLLSPAGSSLGRLGPECRNARNAAVSDVARGACCGRAVIVWTSAGPALASSGRSGSARWRSRSPCLVQSRSPALADIIGARRVRTAAMISSGSMPWR